MKHVGKWIVVFAIFAAFGVFASCKSTKKGSGLAEYRYVMSADGKSGYTFYRFYANKTFSRGAYGRDGARSGEIETERGTYSGDAQSDGEITLTVTSTFNALKGVWLSVSSTYEERGKISGDTFDFNGIGYVKYGGKSGAAR